LDAVDGAIVDELSQKVKNAGFVPGRSFVGRVVETGFTVSNIAIGDWAFGLTDVQKVPQIILFPFKTLISHCSVAHSKNSS
jgi:NADPH:quinone reductase-like Zn-dependent oxidoreductase